MGKPADWNYHPSVTKNHSFFWDTKLTEERMWEISDWLGSLTPEQRKLLDDMLADMREEAEWREGRE